jgi:hypothetical protein
MPRRLLDRCQPDSIQQFRAAARKRYDDGLALAATHQRTGAIYLWGYTAEMVLKAAYFAFIGLAENATITVHGQQSHLSQAIQRGRSLHIAWPNQGAGHNIRAWSELLIAARASSPTTAYPSSFDLEVQRYGQRFEPLWRETLRYRRNQAYLYEVKQAREAAAWLLSHSSAL